MADPIKLDYHAPNRRKQWAIHWGFPVLLVTALVFTMAGSFIGSRQPKRDPSVDELIQRGKVDLIARPTR